MSTRPTTTPKPAAKAPVQEAASHRRPGAVTSPEMINLFEAAVVSPKSPAGRRSASAPTARLLLKAWVNNVAYEKKVWVDVDLVGRSGRSLESRSLPLGYVEPAGGSGDFFLVDAPVPSSDSSGRQGPPERVEYRLYYEVGGQVFTDGIPHRHQLTSGATKNGHSATPPARARRATLKGT